MGWEEDCHSPEYYTEQRKKQNYEANVFASRVVLTLLAVLGFITYLVGWAPEWGQQILQWFALAVGAVVAVGIVVGVVVMLGYAFRVRKP
jgi:sterol desaturase/sphingolipid hydroxylase (fatty acid hydroxylase superfamily)